MESKIINTETTDFTADCRDVGTFQHGINWRAGKVENQAAARSVVSKLPGFNFKLSEYSSKQKVQDDFAKNVYIACLHFPCL